MTWLAVDSNGDEFRYNHLPSRGLTRWNVQTFDGYGVSVPKGSIEKMTGRKLTWYDDPIEELNKEEL